MIILIDGYNVLKKLFSHVQGKLDRHKLLLAKQLAVYKSNKNGLIKEIILVFDGGEAHHATREIRSSIVVMHAGQKSSADDWIVAYAEKNKGKEMVLVSQDRALVLLCELYGVVSMTVDDFYSTLQANIEQAKYVSSNNAESGGPIHKYNAMNEASSIVGSSNDNALLNMLMEQASLYVPDKEKSEQGLHFPEKRQNKKSKKDRAMRNIVKKLM